MSWKPSASEAGDLYNPLRTAQFYVPPGFIDLGLGDPQFSLLPLDALRQASIERFSLNDPEFLQYGAKQGDGKFLHLLAGFLSRAYGFPVEPTTLFITSGASMGLHLICTLFTRPGDTIFVEEPTYFFALRLFADHHLNLVPIRTDENGLLIASLEENLSRVHPKFLYIIPTYQNPTGHTLPQERRDQLVSLSRQHDFLIAADEVYHFLGYSGQLPQPLAAWVSDASVISLGSFSKILAPGLRLGWVQASPAIIQRFVNCGLLDSSGGMNPFTSAIVSRMLENTSLEQNIARLVAIYRHRFSVMDTALRQSLPDVVYTLPRGGYFFWVRLPQGMNASRLQPQAQACKVGFRPGDLFSSQGGMQDYIRLCVAFYEPDDIQEGIRRLRDCLVQQRLLSMPS